MIFSHIYLFILVTNYNFITLMRKVFMHFLNLQLSRTIALDKWSI